MPIQSHTSEEFPVERTGPAMPAQTGNESNPWNSWDDKEIFLRKVFDEDPRKGCELLFKQYYQPLCSHAVRYVYSKEIAQDLVGELFYAFWQKQLYRHIATSFRAYLFIAVRNRALKHIRREFGRVDGKVNVADVEQASLQPNPQQAMQYHELSARIESGIRALSPQCQKVFLLNRFEGRKYQEIATELKVSLKTVEAHMSKALDALRKVVRDEVLVAWIVLLFY